MKIKLFENAALSKKAKAVELMLAGGGVIVTTLLIEQFAVFAIGVFGLYRWFIKKRRTEGLIYIAIAAVAYFIMQTQAWDLISDIPNIVGGLMIVWGLVLLLLHRRKTKKGPESE